MDNRFETIETFKSLYHLYYQQNIQFKEKYKYAPEVYHIYNIKRALNGTQVIFYWLYVVFGAIVLPLFLFFINKNWFHWLQISFFLIYIFIILIIAAILYWIQKKQNQKKSNLINKIDTSYKTLKSYFDNHPEILELYNNGQLEPDDAELVETFQDKIKKREKMIQQIEKIIKNKK